MKRVLRYAGIVIGFGLVIIGVAIVYVKQAYPKVGPVAEVKINNPDAAMIERGAYLANHVAGCVPCHTPRDIETFGVPPIHGKEGMGGVEFGKDFGFPGTFYSKNITPHEQTGIGSWSDAQLFHTITTGERRNGEPLFPFMPYLKYGKADPDDIQAIVAYLRTLKPIENPVKDSEADFPISLIMRTKPCDADFRPMPRRNDKIAYGKYLFDIAACEDCHTQRHKGELIMEKYMAGGAEFKFRGMGTVRSANLTPDPQTGIGAWDEALFIKTMKSYTPVHWKQKGYQTVMPWPEYAGMAEEDLSAIFAYLRTLEPVKNAVVKWTPESDASAMAN